MTNRRQLFIVVCEWSCPGNLRHVICHHLARAHCALVGSIESDIARDSRRQVLQIETLSDSVGGSFDMVGSLLLLSHFPFIRRHYLFTHGIFSTSPSSVSVWIRLSNDPSLTLLC